jgi:Family of unknown function (DUF6519)
MYGDFSRVLNQPLDGCAGVLAEQGRALLDAEINEHNAILLGYLRRLMTDLVGPCAGPAHRCGFGVTPTVTAGEMCDGIQLSSGRYYVHGLRCEEPAPFHPPGAGAAISPPLAAPFIVHLGVWEQTISVIQAPELLDPALASSAPDTTRRSQVRWCVITAAEPEPQAVGTIAVLATEPSQAVGTTAAPATEPSQPVGTPDPTWSLRPRMSARAAFSADPEEPPASSPPPPAYRGAENQLYRIEIHRPGHSDQATFKWSRDNGSVEFGVSEQGGTYTLSDPWRDPSQALAVQQWVELVDDGWAPFGSPGPLLQIASGIGSTVTFLTTPSHPIAADRHPTLRRWDQGPDAPADGIKVTDATGRWYELEASVQIRFTHGPVTYERGDYWLVPARPATRGVIWPAPDGKPREELPHGPLRYLAPLALVQSLTGQPEVIDLRKTFEPAARW